MQKEEVDALRKAKAEGAFYVPAEKKVALVVRIRGINKHSPRVIRILRLLRLRQINNATFVRLNKASVNLLRKVEPFVMYGLPSLATVRKLIYKRGFLKLNKQRIPITSNQVVRELHSYNFNCTEDLVHEIFTCGPNFKQANNALWPFKLNNPRGGFKAKRHPFIRGGDWGNRDNYINEIVARML
jgi:large subunit ribosomal protein L7e